MDLPARIKWAMAHGGYTSQKKLADKIGMPQSVISNLLTGVAETSSYLKDIAIECKVSPNWLITGKGERTIGQLEGLFHDLSEPNQDVILDMMRALKDRQPT